jgi:hypothetical protein
VELFSYRATFAEKMLGWIIARHFAGVHSSIPRRDDPKIKTQVPPQQPRNP